MRPPTRRPCFHDDYLPTFNRPTVTLVDTKGQGISGVAPNGIVYDGRTYECDVVIWATGFSIGKPGAQMAGGVRGRGGESLDDKYERMGVSTLHGIFSRGFPNLYMMGGPQSGFPFNFMSLIEQQGTHVARLIAQCIKGGVRRVEPKQSAERAWVQALVQVREGEGGRGRARDPVFQRVTPLALSTIPDALCCTSPDRTVADRQPGDNRVLRGVHTRVRGTLARRGVAPFTRSSALSPTPPLSTMLPFDYVAPFRRGLPPRLARFRPHASAPNRMRIRTLALGLGRMATAGFQQAGSFFLPNQSYGEGFNACCGRCARTHVPSPRCSRRSERGRRGRGGETLDDKYERTGVSTL